MEYLYILFCTCILFLMMHKYILPFGSVMEAIKMYVIPFSKRPDFDDVVLKTPKKLNKNEKKEEVKKFKFELPKQYNRKDSKEIGSLFEFNNPDDENDGTKNVLGEKTEFVFEAKALTNTKVFEQKSSKEETTTTSSSITLVKSNNNETNSSSPVFTFSKEEEDDVFDKPDYVFQRLFPKKKEKTPKQKAKEYHEYVSSRTPKVDNNDTEVANNYLLKELDRYKARMERERWVNRRQTLLKQNLNDLHKLKHDVFDSNDESKTEVHARLPKLNLALIDRALDNTSSSSPMSSSLYSYTYNSPSQSHSEKQINWSCSLCNTMNSHDEEVCIACRASKKKSTMKMCPACRTTSKISETLCFICGFDLTQNMKINVEYSSSPRDTSTKTMTTTTTTNLLSKAVSFDGFVDDFDLSNEKNVCNKELIREKNQEFDLKENASSMPFRSINLDLEFEHHKTPVISSKSRTIRRRRLVDVVGPCLTPSGESVFKPLVDNVRIDNQVSKTMTKTNKDSSRQVKDILAEMSSLWENFPE